MQLSESQNTSPWLIPDGEYEAEWHEKQIWFKVGNRHILLSTENRTRKPVGCVVLIEGGNARVKI